MATLRPLENPHDTGNAAEHLHDAAQFLETSKPLDARDWSGFFAALAAFAKELLPIILPLFIKTPKPKPTDNTGGA